MAQATQVWYTQAPPIHEQEQVERGDAHPECSICYCAYDNIFKAPKLLECTHAFCLECLSRLWDTVLGLKQDTLPCPLCRHPTAIPESGTPALPTCSQLLAQLPQHQQQLETVWVDGQQLCYQCPVGANGALFCVCVNIGTSMPMGQPPRPDSLPSRQHLCRPFSQIATWKWLLLLVLLTIVFFCVMFWQLRSTFIAPSINSSLLEVTLAP